MTDVNSPKDVSSLFEERRRTRDVEIAVMNEVDAAISGEFPSSYDGLFSEKDIKIKLQTTRSTYDTLRKYLAEVPILPHVDAIGRKDSTTAKDKAETVEKVARGYHNGAALRGGPGFDTLASILADHMVAFYDGVMLIHPDHNRKLVYFEPKDPRCHYPPTGWGPWSMNPLDGTLLVYEMTLGECKQRYATDAYGDAIPEKMAELNNAFRPSFGPAGNFESDDSRIIKIGAYRSRGAWYIVAISDRDVVLERSETGDPKHPGVCGVVSFKQHGPPLLLGQIGIEAALMKVMNQQIQNTERINKAPIVGPPLLGDTLRWGEYNVVDLSLMQGRTFQPQRMAPDSPNNLTQVMASLLSLSDRFNYNPESAQGQGPAVSGKAIQQLQAGPRSLVTSVLFGPYKTAFPRAYDDAMELELNLWPNERKTAKGLDGRKSFQLDYTPSSALTGFKGQIRIEDAQPGGYNAFLEATQKKDAELMSPQTVMEYDPDIRDVETEIRRIAAYKTESTISAAFDALGAQDPLMAIKASAEVLKLINDGKSRAEAIQAVIESGMLEPPAPEPEMAPPGGLPPDMAAALGQMGPPPALAEARGF